MVQLRASATGLLCAAGTLVSGQNECADEATRFDLSDPPYTNYFYSDCNTAAQVVVTSPLPDSDLSIIGPRLLVSDDAGQLTMHPY